MTNSTKKDIGGGPMLLPLRHPAAFKDSRAKTT